MFNKSKYTNWYYNIINYRLLNPTIGETHHIIPKCMNGTNDQSNLVTLTIREHYICHRLLTKMTSGTTRQKLFLALACFTKPIQARSLYINSRVVEQARVEANLYLSSIRKGNATRPAGTYNHSAETKAKQSASALGIVKRPAGYTHDPATIEKMRANRKGKNLGATPWNKGLEQICPHCGKLVRGTLNRWHGERCKLKPDASQLS